MHSRPTQSSWRSRSGNIAWLRRLCRAAKARQSSTRRTRSEFPLKRWTVSCPPPLRSPSPALRSCGLQSPGCGHPATDPIVEGGERVVFLSSDDEDAIRSRGGFGQRTRVRTRQAGKAQRGWRAGARTRPHLGSAHLPGFVQAVNNRPPCDLARDGMVPKRPMRSDRLDVRTKERYR
jgi:hypothetical protein